ncbi:MAG: hypothetical protein J3K34DRAFT_406450, partial [Monoraphidium minutum]
MPFERGRRGRPTRGARAPPPPDHPPRRPPQQRRRRSRPRRERALRTPPAQSPRRQQTPASSPHACARPAAGRRLWRRPRPRAAWGTFERERGPGACRPLPPARAPPAAGSSAGMPPLPIAASPSARSLFQRTRLPFVRLSGGAPFGRPAPASGARRTIPPYHSLPGPCGAI